MSPLYHRIAKQLTLPKKDRDRMLHDTGLPHLLNGAACFDLAAVSEMVKDIAEKFRQGGIDGKRAFLPAPKTWIEMVVSSDGVYSRHGILIEQSDDCETASYVRVLEQKLGKDCFYWPSTNEDKIPRSEVGCYSLARMIIPMGADLADNRQRRKLTLCAAELSWNHLSPFEVYAALAIINTPRLIGRRVHAPHRGLERDLLRQQKIIGSYPLRAWSEITLEANPTYKADDGTEQEVRLTGRKCLHFCRAHLRVRNGRLEMVNSHWRGDPALGIKQSRYRVVH